MYFINIAKQVNKIFIGWLLFLRVISGTSGEEKNRKGRKCLVYYSGINM